jgi:hypothetical protein
MWGYYFLHGEVIKSLIIKLLKLILINKKLIIRLWKINEFVKIKNIDTLASSHQPKTYIYWSSFHNIMWKLESTDSHKKYENYPTLVISRFIVVGIIALLPSIIYFILPRYFE